MPSNIVLPYFILKQDKKDEDQKKVLSVLWKSRKALVIQTAVKTFLLLEEVNNKAFPETSSKSANQNYISIVVLHWEEEEEANQHGLFNSSGHLEADWTTKQQATPSSETYSSSSSSSLLFPLPGKSFGSGRGLAS